MIIMGRKGIEMELQKNKYQVITEYQIERILKNYNDSVQALEAEQRQVFEQIPKKMDILHACSLRVAEAKDTLVSFSEYKNIDGLFETLESVRITEEMALKDFESMLLELIRKKDELHRVYMSYIISGQIAPTPFNTFDLIYFKGEKWNTVLKMLNISSRSGIAVHIKQIIRIVKRIYEIDCEDLEHLRRIAMSAEFYHKLQEEKIL